MNSDRPAHSISFVPDKDGRREYFAESAFVSLLLITAFVPAEIASGFYVAVIFICLYLANWKIKRGLVSLLIPFSFLFLLGMLGALHHPLFDVMKDVWYLAKVALTLSGGYLLMRHLKSLQQICRLVVVAAVIGSMLHLLQMALYFQSGVSLLDLRQEIGSGSFVTVLGLGLLVGCRGVRRYIGLDKWSYYLAILLCGGSVVISMSRTYIISIALIFLILRGWGRPKLTTFLMLSLLGIMVAVVWGTFSSNQYETSLVGKFTHSATEVAISDYGDMRDINLHWRGFESYRALVTYLGGSSLEQAVGQGFGATVDLGFYMNLGGGDFRFIPTLHNGYFYILIKFGLVGLLIYLYFILRLIRSNKREAHSRLAEVVLAKRLISSLGWVLFVSTFVIAGVFNKFTLDPALILVGSIHSWMRRKDIHVNRDKTGAGNVKTR